MRVLLIEDEPKVAEAVREGLEAEGFMVRRERTGEAVTAFQRHWRPALIDGCADPSTRQTLVRLMTARQEQEPYSMPGHSIRFRPKDRP